MCRIRLANEVKGIKSLRALKYSLLVKCPIADSKYCFSKVFTGFPNTIYQLIQGTMLKFEKHEGDMSSLLTCQSEFELIP